MFYVIGSLQIKDWQIRLEDEEYNGFDVVEIVYS